MQIRIQRQTQNGKTYEYAQLVESYRRAADGMPMHRVVASLGRLSQLEIENFRAALQAAREKKRVVVAAAPATPTLAPSANLRYLDLAVLRELWCRLGLRQLFDELMPAGGGLAAPGEVVSALAIQRCVEPDSKLAATRWFPTTALPELTGIAPKTLNNTRLHRVLEQLEATEIELQARLPRLLHERQGAFASLFVDVTDAWFVGEGPELAARAKTKEGLVRQKIGIVLMCNEQGFPLRWEVVSGSSADCTVMTAMLRSVCRLPWLGEAPVVCDRAMGHSAQLCEMNRLGLRFLTALTVSEMGFYAKGLPYETLGALPAELSEKAEARCAAQLQAAQVVVEAGMQPVAENLFVLDLGIVERAAEAAPAAQPITAGTAAETLGLARQIREGCATGRFSSQATAARELGLSKSLASKYCGLLGLPEDLQRVVLEGKAEHSLARLLEIAALADADRQRDAFRALPPGRARPAAVAQPRTERAEEEPLKVRVAAYFNPERFVEQRANAQRRLEEILRFVEQLNAELARPQSRRSAQRALSAVDRKLRSHDLVEAFAVRACNETNAKREHVRVEVTLDKEEWARRRRYDGFTVLVAHPSVKSSAVDLCKLYRAKDVVEKDFQTIKSVVELRPIRHREDSKVRAHVTLCMLALVLERALQQQLTEHAPRLSVNEALARLEQCRLNRYDGESEAAYLLTKPTEEQKKLLTRLGMSRLAVQDEISATLVAIPADE